MVNAVLNLIPECIQMVVYGELLCHPICLTTVSNEDDHRQLESGCCSCDVLIFF